MEGLKLGQHDFNLLKRSKVVNNQSQLDLVTKKGVFPYDYFHSVRQFKRLDKLPSRKRFFNQIRQGDISESDYQHAKKVFKTFKMKSMEDYLKLYNRTDVLLLAEAIIDFRKV